MSYFGMRLCWKIPCDCFMNKRKCFVWSISILWRFNADNFRAFPKPLRSSITKQAPFYRVHAGSQPAYVLHRPYIFGGCPWEVNPLQSCSDRPNEAHDSTSNRTFIEPDESSKVRNLVRTDLYAAPNERELFLSDHWGNPLLIYSLIRQQEQQRGHQHIPRTTSCWHWEILSRTHRFGIASSN